MNQSSSSTTTTTGTTALFIIYHLRTTSTGSITEVTTTSASTKSKTILAMEQPSMLLVAILSFVFVASTCNQCYAYQSIVPTSPRITKLPIHQTPLATSTKINPLFLKTSPSSSSSLFSDSKNNSDGGSLESPEENEKKNNIFARMMDKLKPKSDKNMSTKEMIAKMGLSAMLTYGWISNTFICGTVSAAWFVFNKRTGMSPLAPGQWKGFLGVYAGFYVFNNVIRPFRIGLTVGVSKYFDRAIETIQKRLNVPKAAAIGIVVFLANFVGTCLLMSLGIFIASTLSGVPIFVPKA